jgi:hypothetical protein
MAGVLVVNSSLFDATQCRASRCAWPPGRERAARCAPRRPGLQGGDRARPCMYSRHGRAWQRSFNGHKTARRRTCRAPASRRKLGTVRQTAGHRSRMRTAMACFERQGLCRRGCAAHNRNGYARTRAVCLMNPMLARMGRPTLLYRNSCRKCRLVTLLIVVFSMGMVRRTPNDHPAAVRLMADYDLQPTKLLLVWPWLIRRPGRPRGSAPPR